MGASAVEVRLFQSDQMITVGRLGQTISKLAQSLREIDRLLSVKEMKLPRVQWIVKNLGLNGNDIFLQVTARDGIKLRSEESLFEPIRLFMNGIESLADAPELPEYYSEQTIDHIIELSKKSGGVEKTSLAMVNGHVGKQFALDGKLLENAKKAARGTYEALGSVSGKLDILDGRHASKGYLKLSIFDDSTNRGVTARFKATRSEEVRNYWNTRVLLIGKIKKNEFGQAVEIDVDEIEKMPDETLPKTNFSDLLGVAPDWANGLDPVEYIRGLRGA